MKLEAKGGFQATKKRPKYAPGYDARSGAICVIEQLNVEPRPPR